MSLVSIRQFNFSAFYYHEILEALIQYKRRELPELTEEDPTEPLVNLLSAFALVGHLNNCNLDVVANEAFFDTCQLRSSLRSHLALIGRKLEQSSPATAELLLKWTKAFDTVLTLVPANSLFATEADSENDAIDFELISAFTLTLRTDLVGHVFDYIDSSETYNDYTTEAQTPTGYFVPWPSSPAADDIIYIGHPDVMFDKVRFNFKLAGFGITGIWEYYNGEYDDARPDDVTNLGSQLEFDLTELLGYQNRTGTLVRVQFTKTGAYEEGVSYFSGGINYVKVGFLGQSSPSTDENDYYVGCAWNEVPNLVDGTGQFSSGTGEKDVSFLIPKQAYDYDWKITTVNEIEAYWIRFRICAVESATSPEIYEVMIDEGNQYSSIQVVQGESKSDNPLGSSTGLASQQFIFSEYPVIDDSNLRVWVDEGGDVWSEYSKVDNFISSTAYDRHFTADFDDDGRCTITFGNGTNGKVPPEGTNNIKSTYRIMEEENGNVGSGMIKVNKAGVAYIDAVSNPRSATGFTWKEGYDEDDIYRMKQVAPAEIRVLGRGCTRTDVETLTLVYETSNETKPFARCKVFEESYGPKTFKAVVVGQDGGAVITDLLDDLEEYFNNETDGVVVTNHEVTAVNFDPKTINVTATVYGGNKTAIETALTSKLSSLAKTNDGITYEWEFGEEVPISKLVQIIMDTTPAPRKATITVPSGDVSLNDDQLPVCGTLTITVSA